MSERINYEELSKNEIINLVKQQDALIETMKEEKNNTELLQFPWVGNLGQWYWNVQNNEVVFNDKKVTTLGYAMSDVPEKIGFEFFTEKLHKDDYERVMNNMRDHLSGVSNAYEVEYRIQCKDGKYKWFYDRGRISKRDVSGKPLVLAGIVFDITESKNMEQDLDDANKKLKKLVTIDTLTGIYNRRKLIQVLPIEIMRAKRNKLPLVLLMIDVDKFKDINDTFGHDVGDKVLKEIAKELRERTRETDTLCRFGGDEFIIILPNTNTSSAKNVAHGIKERVMSNDILSDKEISLSIGIAELHKADDFDSLLKKADEKMYQAKNKGVGMIV